MTVWLGKGMARSNYKQASTKVPGGFYAQPGSMKRARRAALKQAAQNVKNQTIAARISKSSGDNLGSIPRDAEWYELQSSKSVVHAAAPNTLRFEQFILMSAYVSIGDENVRVFDTFKIRIHACMSSTTIPQEIHLFLAKGPNAAAFINGDKDPSSGFWAGLESCVSGGTEQKFFRTIATTPLDDGRTGQNADFELNLTKLLNKFTNECELSENLGQSAPQYMLYIAVNGPAAGTDVFYYNASYSYHDRKRRFLSS